MATTFKTKPAKTTAKAKVEPVDSTEYRYEVSGVKEYSDLKTFIKNEEKKLAPYKKTVDAYKAQFKDTADELVEPEDEVYFYEGDREISLSAKQNVTEILDNQKVIDVLGLDAFLAIAKVGITELRKYTTDAQFNAVTKTERTGIRRVKD